MAYIPGLIITEVANVALVKGEATVYGTGANANTAVKAGADADKIMVVTEDCSAGDHTPLQVNGLASVKLGATVVAGALLSTNASGLFITATTGPVVARARKAGVAGDLIEALLG